MSEATENLEAAQKRAMAIRPKAGGFPYLAEALRRAGVKKNIWFLPACLSLYLTDKGPVVAQLTPLISGVVDVPAFDRDALIRALRSDQAGESTFPEFLAASWRAGVLRYEVDLLREPLSIMAATERTTLRPIHRSRSTRRGFDHCRNCSDRWDLAPSIREDLPLFFGASIRN